MKDAMALAYGATLAGVGWWILGRLTIYDVMATAVGSSGGVLLYQATKGLLS